MGQLSAASLLVACLALVLAATSQAQPQPCCLPQQSSVHMTELTSINTKSFAMLEMQSDWDRQQQVLLNVTYTPSTRTRVVNSRMLFDVQKKLLYFIPGNDTSVCYKIPDAFQPIRCIPDDAVYLGTNYLGPLSGSLVYDGWRFNLGTSSDALIVTIATSQSDCVPIVEGIDYPANPANNQLYFFSNFLPSLADPTLFNLPPSCL